MNGEVPAQEAESLIGLIDRLAEPAEPMPVAMTPQTAGWSVLAVILALALIWLAWWRWRRWRANAYRRAALAELGKAGDDAAAIADILRRTALAAWPRAEVASLAGRDWLRFLDATGGEAGFETGPGAVLAAAPYRDGSAPAPGLRDLAARWVRRHRVEGPGEAAP